MSGVSLVIISQDRPELLNRLLLALDQQSLSAFDLVIVANAAPTAPGARPFRFVEFAAANVSRARNAGVRATTGDIIAFCDDDAVPEPRWLERLTAPFAEENTGMAGGFVLRRNGVSLQFAASETDAAGRISASALGAGIHPPQPGRAVVTLGTNCAFRRSALAAIGGFDAAFRYYLDEADVNWRLARAGWHAAIVPDALVHHGFAANAWRGSDRSPKDLFEIAASQVVFLRKHGCDDPRAALAVFRRQHEAVMLEAFSLGKIGTGQVRALRASLVAGIAEGEQREFGRAEDLAPDAAAGEPARIAGPSVRVALCGGLLQARLLRATALALQNAGAQVSVFCFWPGLRRLTVSFDPAGYWLHRGGISGRVERNGALKPGWSRRRRIRAEIARIAGQRDFDIIAEAQRRTDNDNWPGHAELERYQIEWQREPGGKSVPL